MGEFKILSSEIYSTPKKGYSSVSGNKVSIIGEQTILYEGSILEQFLYNIEGYTPENGLPFLSLKSNLVVM